MDHRTLKVVIASVIILCWGFVAWYLFVPTTLFRYYHVDGPRLKCLANSANQTKCTAIFNDKAGTPDSHRPLQAFAPFSYKPFTDDLESKSHWELDFYNPNQHDLGAKLTSDWQTVGKAQLADKTDIIVSIRLRNKGYELRFNVGDETATYTVEPTPDQRMEPEKYPEPIVRSRFDEFVSYLISSL